MTKAVDPGKAAAGAGARHAFCQEDPNERGPVLLAIHARRLPRGLASRAFVGPCDGDALCGVGVAYDLMMDFNEKLWDELSVNARACPACWRAWRDDVQQEKPG